MMEIWKPIKGFEGYEVSNNGNVRSLNYKRTGTPKPLKPYTDKDGYLGVRIGHEDNRPTKRVSRLVAEAFIPNPNNCPEVNHKDECKTNNRADNLEWCTNSYNINYGTGVARRTEALSKPIKAVLPNGSEEYYSSISEASRLTGGYASNISRCLHGEREHANGRRWEFVSKGDK